MKKLALFIIIIGSVSLALADKVQLKDGTAVSGTAKKLKDGFVELTNEHGETNTYTRDEVRRVVFESTTTVAEMLDMLDYFEGLIAPAFGLGEPLQREFAHSYYRGGKTQNTRPTTHTNRTIVHAGKITRELVSNDTFVDDWVRFAAQFDGIRKMRTFKNIYKTKVRTKSLAEFARYPVEGREDLSDALREAIQSVKSVFKKAKRATNLLNALRKKDLSWDRRIRAAEASSRLVSASRSATSEDKAVANAHTATLRANKMSEIDHIRLSSDDETNRVAAGRIIAMQLFEDVRRQSQAFLPQPDEPNSGP